MRKLLYYICFYLYGCGAGLYPGAHTITQPEAPAIDCAVRAWEDTIGPVDSTCRARVYSSEILLSSDPTEIQRLCMAHPNEIYGCTTIHDKGYFLLWSLGTRPLIVASVENPRWTPTVLPGLLVHETAHILSGCSDPGRWAMDSAHARPGVWGPEGVVDRGTECAQR